MDLYCRYNHKPNDSDAAPHPKKRWTDLGGLDVHALHGSCDLRRGAKWIATMWINPPTWYAKASRAPARNRGPRRGPGDRRGPPRR